VAVIGLPFTCMKRSGIAGTPGGRGCPNIRNDGVGGADSDDVAQAFRNDVAHHSEMMSPIIPSDAARVAMPRWQAISAIRF
jgi:hypothetical protein